jgi:hypothetical protein
MARGPRPEIYRINSDHRFHVSANYAYRIEGAGSTVVPATVGAPPMLSRLTIEIPWQRRPSRRLDFQHFFFCKRLHVSTSLDFTPRRGTKSAEARTLLRVAK